MRIAIDPETVARNFAAFQENPALQESAQLFARGLPVAEMVQAFALNRSVLSAFAGFDAIYPHGNLERGLLEKVILCVSLGNNCQFCVHSHMAITSSLGIANTQARDPGAAVHSAREALAIEYAVAVQTNSNRVQDELFQRLRAAFADPELVELTFVIGFINMLNWFNNALGVRYHGEFADVSIH